MHNRVFFILLLISIILGFGILTRGHDWGDDFASYIMQAQSISDGTIRTFMERNRFTIHESFVYIGPTAYPWGYPLSLVPALWLRGIHPIVLKLPGLAFFAGFLVCLYLLMKTRFSSTESLLLVSVFGFNPMLIRFLDQILSDIPFLFFSTLSLYLFLQNDRLTIKKAIWIGLSIGLAFFVRRQGILLLGAYLASIAWNAWRIKKINSGVKESIKHGIIVLLAFGFLWFITGLIFPSEGNSYLVQYNDFQIEKVAEFAGAYTLVFGDFFGSHWIWSVVYWIMVAFFFIGLWMHRSKETILIIFLILWMLLLVTWPFWQGARFIFPLLPVFIYFAFAGMKFLIERLPLTARRNGSAVLYIFLLLISVAFLFTTSRNMYINLQSDRDIGGPFDAFSDEMFAFIREQTPRDSVVIFFKPRAMSLFTGRLSFSAIDCSRLASGDYVSIHKKWDNSQIMPNQIDECGTPLQTVFENRRFIVYQILK